APSSGRGSPAWPPARSSPARSRSTCPRVPAGDYVYTVHAGAFPDGSVTSASFPITKAAGALAVRADDGAWEATGWDAAPPAASAASSEAAPEAPAALTLSAP